MVEKEVRVSEGENEMLILDLPKTYLILKKIKIYLQFLFSHSVFHTL